MMISIIIPAYNSEKSIVKCLNSVKNQTYQSYEVIVINDGSLDSTSQLVEQYMYDHPTLNISLISQNNSGVACARNAGIKVAKGKYIAFLDSDDLWLNNKLELQMNYFFNDPDIMLVGGIFKESEINNSVLNPNHQQIAFNSQLLSNHFLPSTVIFKREFFEQHGGFPIGQRYAEEGMIFYIATYYYKCIVINQKLIDYGGGKSLFGDSGLSANLVEMEKGELRNLYRIFNEGYIGLFKFLILTSFSLLKFSRRLIVVTFRRSK